MKTLRFTIPALVVLLMAVAFRPKGENNLVITGTVVSAATGKPLGNVHVYVVDGEEEALTNSRGEFRIESSKKPPFTIYAAHPDYQKYQGTVTNSSRQQIRLKPR